MPSTTLKLPEALKRRIARVIEGTDTTMHAFLLSAAERAAAAAERRAAFVQSALRAREEVATSRRGYSPDELEAWTRKRLAGTGRRRPGARRWR